MKLSNDVSVDTKVHMFLSLPMCKNSASKNGRKGIKNWTKILRVVSGDSYDSYVVLCGFFYNYCHYIVITQTIL